MSGKRRALRVCGVVLFSLLVLATTTSCGRKKPPQPLKQDTAQLFAAPPWPAKATSGTH